MAQLTGAEEALVARCPRCSTLVAPDARVCAWCGLDLADRLLELVAVPDGPVPDGSVPRRERAWRRWSLLGLVAVVAALALADLAGGLVVALRPGCRPVATGGPGSLPLTDRCSGTVLVVDGPDGEVETLDLDRGRIAPLQDPHLDGATPGAATRSLSAGHLAVVDHGEAWSVALRPGGVDHRLGPARVVLDDGAGGWWVIGGAGPHAMPGEAARRARGDRAGTGPGLVLGAGVTPALGVDGQLVVSSEGGALALVSGRHPRALPTGLAVTRVVAGQRRTLVVTAPDRHLDPSLWAVDVPTGRVRLLGRAGRIGSGVSGAPGVKFSPDGRRLAVVAGLPPRGGVAAGVVTVLDVVDGRVTPIPGGGTTADQPALAWSADSKAIFFLQAGGPVGRTLGVYRLGDPSAGTVRFFPGPAQDLIATSR
ncbi:MAG: hypothetical protein NVSMB12_14140 [Acidimicrobiales bacterium]